MIKVGLIGVGFMGSTHALCYEVLAGSVDFQVTAVADLNSETAHKIARKFGAKVYASGAELIEQADVNTIDICLPTYLHTVHALQAIEKGYDVFIEKPVCLIESEAERLLEAQRKSGVKVMVGHCLRFWPEYEALKQLHEQKTYGSFLSGVFTRVSPRPAWGWEDWIHDPQRSGTVALDLHIHDVDYVRYLLGEPDKISSEVIHSDGKIEHIFGQFRYGSGVASLEASWNYPSGFPFEMSYRVKYEQATVLFSSLKSPSLTIYGNDGSVIVPELAEDEQSRDEERGGNISSLGGYLNELRYFLSCLDRGEDIRNATLADGVASFRLVMREIERAQERSGKHV